MIVIPAVDLREGTCVQLVGGSYTEEKLRLDDPVQVARDWAQRGFSWLHVVDLDAATGRGDNTESLREILRTSDMLVQVGGGIRDEARVEQLIAEGAARVVVGTRALEEPRWIADLAESFPAQIVVAADVRERTVVTRGWSHSLSQDVEHVVTDLATLPLAAIMVTAVHREGLLAGADLSLMESVVEAARSVPVLASGGVSSLADVRALQQRGVAGSIVGMALYTGALAADAAAREFGGMTEPFTL
ncbi:MAG TPA: 1-(5-phosphoribosyl)-5-[(5-phosphoribosylamino)methylideneamino]imidazole-4-carboxamide isomerase [Gemmatimonadales bacterium]|nr:1-(5-phosphoribosyl)-5-[(5-phosphoribosylamino)methylideneamino]imidazole-4-carboxamide isomerase [Gemmatimonadales bacterium]